jgi:hypothetical protein
MTHEISEPFHGDASRAMQFAAASLTAAGFRIDEVTDTALRATGRMMCNSKENPLVGVSNLEIVAGGGTLRGRAELNSLKKFFFLMVFVLLGVLAVVEIIFLLVPMHDNSGHLTGHWMMLVPLLAMSPWVVLLPLIYVFMLKRVKRAAETLLHNCAVASQ